MCVHEASCMSEKYIRVSADERFAGFFGSVPSSVPRVDSFCTC